MVDRIIYLVIIGFLLFMVYALYSTAFGPAAERRENFNRKCEEAGGLPYRSRDATTICIRKESLIEVK